jgi:PIN domain nuclease of toxin-antitoxin system
MNLLLDTHIFLWWITDEPRLSGEAKDIMMNPNHTIWFSAASASEISIKAPEGKVKMVRELQPLLDKEGFSFLPIGLSETERMATLPDIHQDPFDRILVSQSLEYGYTLLTADENVLKYPVPHFDCRR